MVCLLFYFVVLYDILFHFYLVVLSFYVSASKIQGWFKNQRTQVGKLMNPTKKKSGMGMEVLTVRKKWQLSNFAYLRAYIVPRSYSHDTEVSVY